MDGPFRAPSQPDHGAGVDARVENVDRCHDRLGDDVLADLDRCLRRQLWTIIGVSIVAIVILSAMFGGLLAAFGRQRGAALSVPVFSVISAVAVTVGMLHHD